MSSLRERLSTGFARRAALLRHSDLDAFRLFNGAADGVDGVVIEKLGPVLVVQLHEGRFAGDLEALRDAVGQHYRECGATAVYLKKFVRDRSGVDDETVAEHREPTPWIGEPAPERIIVREGPLRFIVRPYDGFSVGLFLEQRDNRRRVREMAKDRRVLNTFSYTCGFSVAAAAGGATSVSSVDLSVRYLEWGKENFTENSISLDGHWFFRSDTFEFYERATRQNRRFDMVILDPPTFSKTRRPNRVFVLKDRLDDLVRGALRLLDPGGLLLVSCNDRQLTLKALEAAVHHAAEPRRATILERPRLPEDFAGDADYAKSLIARIDGSV
ncbi:MAG: class I SAM-dependent rRNA methyltransferase [Planctomycetes bacterium]|nr:class I SAM-dependent rRNA methyltransferase [Planctomycetota bacterium]